MFIQDENDELRHNLRCLHCFFYYGKETTIKNINRRFNLKTEYYYDMPISSFLLQDRFCKVEFKPEHLLQFFFLFIPSLNIISYELSNTAFDFKIKEEKRIKTRKKIGRLVSEIIDYIFEQGYFFVFKDMNKGFIIKEDNELKLVNIPNFKTTIDIKTVQYYISEQSKNGTDYLIIKDKPNGEECKFKVRLKKVKEFGDFCPIKSIKDYERIDTIIMSAIKTKYHCPICYERTYRRYRCCEKCDKLLVKIAKHAGLNRRKVYDRVIKTIVHDSNEAKEIHKNKLIEIIKNINECKITKETQLELLKEVNRAFS